MSPLLKGILIVTLLPVTVSSQTTPTTPAAAPSSVITAEQLLDRAANVSNMSGKKLGSFHISGEMQATSGRVEADYETFVKSPDDELTWLEIHGHGAVKYGREHGKSWSDYRLGEIGPGPAVALNGVSVKMLAHALHVWNEADWRDRYGKVELAGRSQDKSGECVLVRLWPKAAVKGDVETRCYDIHTLLLARLDGVQRFRVGKDSPEKAMVVTFWYSNYVDVQGFKVPRRLESRVVGLELTYSNMKIDINTPIADSTFADTSKR